MSQDRQKANEAKSNQHRQRGGDRQDQGKLIGGARREKVQRREEERKRRGKRFRPYKQYAANDPDRPNWTPWLLIRGSLTDLGLRPFPIYPSRVTFNWCVSPDIWVEPHGHIVPEKDNFVCVRIFNLGMADAIPVKVDFSWAPLTPSLLDPLRPSLFSPTVHLISTEWVEIPALTSKEVRCKTPYNPDVPDRSIDRTLIFADRTLIVNCSNPILDPITNPVQPNLDRHVGWWWFKLIG